MLSLERCRALLDSDCPLTDAQIERLRDQIRVHAEVIFDTMNAPGFITPFSEALRRLPDSEEAEECAAILEFDGGMSRNRAEKKAVMNFMKGDDR
jgi:hypothetical protein